MLKREFNTKFNRKRLGFFINSFFKELYIFIFEIQRSLSVLILSTSRHQTG